MNSSEIPIVVTCYNRPDHLRRVLEVLAAERVEPLYFSCDGPADESDRGDVEETRKVARSVDWTEALKRCWIDNLGLQRAIPWAVDWMLERYPAMILLEDDCVPSPDFVPFARECLGRYADNERVMSVGGWSPDLGGATDGYPYDAYFLRRIETWGWATWRRAWKHYRRDFGAAFQKAQERGIDLACDGSDIVANIQATIDGRLHGWSPGWLLGVFLRGGYCIYPTKSLIANIGFDGSGASCGPSDRYDLELGPRPVRFPEEVGIYPPIQAAVREFYR